MNLIPNIHRRPGHGFTFPEMLISMGVGAIVLAAVMYAMVFCTRSFLAMGNYMDLNKASLNALDKISRDIRECTSLQTFATNKLVFLDANTNQLTFTWDPSARQLTRVSGTATNILLKNCDFLAFHISQRNPSNNVFGFYPATNNPAICKLVDVSWRCYRTIYGYKINTESVQTARIVMRN